MDDQPLALHAFHLARERWRTATGQSNGLRLEEDHVRFAAIGEALFWAAAVDEITHGPEERTDLCRALSFARNRATHDLVWTAAEHPGAIFPITFPTKFTHYIWCNADALPLPVKGPGSGKDAQAARDAYTRAFQGRRVEDSLDDLANHFAKRRGESAEDMPRQKSPEDTTPPNTAN